MSVRIRHNNNYDTIKRCISFISKDEVIWQSTNVFQFHTSIDKTVFNSELKVAKSRPSQSGNV